MSIIENQVLEFQNVLSFRGKVTQQELENKPKEMEEILFQNGAVKKGPFVSVTHGVEPDLLTLLFDVELLVPMEGFFEPPEGYIIINSFYLNNALKITHRGPQTAMGLTLNELSTYISNHHYVPTTPVYSVLKDRGYLSSEFVEMEVDLYVGVKNSEEGL